MFARPLGHLETFMGYLEQTRPETVLEIDLARGGLGIETRRHLDALPPVTGALGGGRRRLDGIELFADEVPDYRSSLYDSLHPGEALEVIERLGSYDLIVLGDALGRQEKEQAHAFLEACFAHATRALVLFIPLGKNWPGKFAGESRSTPRRSFWFFADFSGFAAQRTVRDTPYGPYAAFLLKKEDYLAHRVESFMKAGTPAAAIQHGIRERLNLCAESVARVDLGRLARHVGSSEHLKYFLDTGFREHYRLIAHLSSRFRNSHVFDIGTNKGYSALALSYEPTNTVISYDIVACREIRHPEDLASIEFRIGDVLADPRLLSSPFIVLDTDHDGVFERRLCRHLKMNGYRGVMLLDDIHLNCAMIRLWEEIAEPKTDVTDLGHYSGSGLVEFGPLNRIGA
jgi:hypothetical protein